MPDGPIIKGVLTGLTPAEKLYLLVHPHHISIIQDNAAKALAEAARLFPGPELHNGRGDAFRHCFWSALLARDIGAQNARSFTNAHEAYSANPPRERAMDLHNNAAGIAIGAHREGSSDAEISRLCRAALDAGTLMTTLPATGEAY
jgi:hypothetical protein